MKPRLMCTLIGLAGGLAFGQALSPDRLEAHGVRIDAVTYRGRAAVRVTDADPSAPDGVKRLAIVGGTSFQDGTIEVALSGDTAPDADVGLRGFVGIAFRVAAQGDQYECIYLRPKNGRAQDQLQRNHSTQYISVPGFPWQKLRSETPGKYESYVDLVPGQWTKVKIQVSGANGRLFVDHAAEPVLVVNDLKQKPVKGPVALWVGPGTIAHFADLKLTQ
ncbi:MAG TPA: hypothetical protein VMS37_36225 [Verrucomicrobiae bacterium]|nr:hypothetical protein [Verrucomicrobiae bacterium]